MTTRALARLSAAIEAATGLALIALPDLVARVLLGVGLSGGGIAVGRVAGFGLLALGLACRPGNEGCDSAGHSCPVRVRPLWQGFILAISEWAEASSAICYGRCAFCMWCWDSCWRVPFDIG